MDSGAALRRARRHIGMVFQEYNLVERLSVMENLLCGRLGYVGAWKAWRRKFPSDDIERAFRLLETAPSARTTVASPIRWAADAAWKHRFLDVGKLSPEEIAERRKEFDVVKAVAKAKREGA